MPLLLLTRTKRKLKLNLGASANSDSVKKPVSKFFLAWIPSSDCKVMQADSRNAKRSDACPSFSVFLARFLVELENSE